MLEENGKIYPDVAVKVPAYSGLAMTLAEALAADYARLQRQLTGLAEAMPGDKYEYRPSPAVRTFGEQLRHVGAVQWVVGSGLLDEKPPVDVGDGDSGPWEMTDKTEILRYVSGSFAQMRRAIATVNEGNLLEMVPHPYDPEHTKFDRLTLVGGYASHGWEHYGQLVVYLRLNGITPPTAPL